MRIVFMGTPDFACPTLRALVRHGYEISAVYTRAPKPFGRGMRHRIRPVHALASDLGLPVITPPNFRSAAAVEAFRALAADVAVVVAYGLILPSAILSAPRHGCLNLHGSLLPRWRGAAPIPRSVMAGDKETGIVVMRMEPTLDTGPVAMVDKVAITDEMTSGELHDELAVRGAALMVRALQALEQGTLAFTTQSPDGVVYAAKIDNTECRIRWDDGATMVHNQIRGLSPVPGAFFEADLGRGRERIKVLRAKRADRNGPPGEVLDMQLTVGCGEGSLNILEMQRAGKMAMAATEFLRGTPVGAGTKLY
jgi:methionyl-tRNA formyltransferase